MARLVVRRESGEMESERIKMESRCNGENKVCGTQKKCEIERESLWDLFFFDNKKTPQQTPKELEQLLQSKHKNCISSGEA